MTFTYLLRYVADPAATIAELGRVLRPGGLVAGLDFFVPPSPLWWVAWLGYTRLVLPPADDRMEQRHMWGKPRPGGAALAALVGRNRAAVLRTIANGCSTTELADRVGISLAAASQHASVLRDAGLITTQRQGSAVLHLITPLGAELLRAG